VPRQAAAGSKQSRGVWRRAPLGLPLAHVFCSGGMEQCGVTDGARSLGQSGLGAASAEVIRRALLARDAGFPSFDENISGPALDRDGSPWRLAGTGGDRGGTRRRCPSHGRRGAKRTPFLDWGSARRSLAT
jgi:hypothetical protein